MSSCVAARRKHWTEQPRKETSTRRRPWTGGAAQKNIGVVGGRAGWISTLLFLRLPMSLPGLGALHRGYLRDEQNEGGSESTLFCFPPLVPSQAVEPACYARLNETTHWPQSPARCSLSNCARPARATIARRGSGSPYIAMRRIWTWLALLSAAFAPAAAHDLYPQRIAAGGARARGSRRSSPSICWTFRASIRTATR